MANWQDFLFRFRWQIAALLIGLILVASGLFLHFYTGSQTDFEIVSVENSSDKSSFSSNLVVEVSGAVNSPGVFELPSGARIEDALKKAGGLSDSVNKNWVEKYLNRASLLVDGQKIYIPDVGDEPNNYLNPQEVISAQKTGTVNINTATSKELEGLHGIGPVYAQKIIDNRPYSNVNELLVKKVLPQKIYDNNKEKMTVY